MQNVKMAEQEIGINSNLGFLLPAISNGVYILEQQILFLCTDAGTLDILGQITLDAPILSHINFQWWVYVGTGDLGDGTIYGLNVQKQQLQVLMMKQARKIL